MTNSGLVISLGGDAVRAHQLATGSVVWSYQIAASGQSDGLVLSGNKVIANRGTTVLCLDADTGGLTWSTTLSGGSNSDWNPVLDAAGNIFVVTASKVRRLSAATGSVEWAVDLALNNRQGGLYNDQHDLCRRRRGALRAGWLHRRRKVAARHRLWSVALTERGDKWRALLLVPKNE